MYTKSIQTTKFEIMQIILNKAKGKIKLQFIFPYTYF